MKNKRKANLRNERGISTMEEDIKILEEIVNKFKNSIKNEGKENYKFFGTMLFYEDIQAIENLIARNKKLEEHCKQLIKEKQELTTIAEENVLSIECVNKNYIPKSKVIEIIEKYYNEHGDTKEEITKFIEKLLQEGDKI